MCCVGTKNTISFEYDDFIAPFTGTAGVGPCASSSPATTPSRPSLLCPLVWPRRAMGKGGSRYWKAVNLGIVMYEAGFYSCARQGRKRKVYDLKLKQ